MIQYYATLADLKIWGLSDGYCETGRSTHKPGEGMISLAHAFRYAGSENLLISLWKVDEKSSMQITNYFLEGLAAGETKDRALKLAKLRYLSESSGRTLSPQYWAGMVLLGDPSPIPLPKTNVGYWWLGLLIVFALIYGGYKVVRSANIRYGRR